MTLILRFVIIPLILAFFARGAFGADSPTQYKFELENQIRDRIIRIVTAAEPTAIVHVKITLKQVSSQLPGIGLEQTIVPVESDGKLGASSINNVEIRVLTREDLPAWLRAEIDLAAKINDVKVTVSYEKIKGTVKAPQSEIAEVFKRFEGDFLENFVKKDMFETFKTIADGFTQTFKEMKVGLWAVLGAISIGAFLGILVLLFLGLRFEKSMKSIIEEKLVPALASASQSAPPPPREKKEKEEQKAQGPGFDMPAGAGATKELADLPVEPLINLLSDCYWTESDGYAHYLWTQMTLDQREKTISSGRIDPNYFSYIRQFQPNNLQYQSDARYLMLTGEFNGISQDDLAAWLRKNQKDFHRITPLRWDLLPLSLPERIAFLKMPQLAGTDRPQPLKLAQTSKPRLLPMRLEVKRLQPSDEVYIMENASLIPKESRRSIKTLAWLALASKDYRAKQLEELDARQLAEAWDAPTEILSKLEECLPAKKLEMLKHFTKSTAPDRTSEAYEFLVEAGLGAPDEGGEAQKAAA